MTRYLMVPMQPGITDRQASGMRNALEQQLGIDVIVVAGMTGNAVVIDVGMTGSTEYDGGDQITPGEAKRKGAATEQMFCDYLAAWVPHVERRHLSGSADRGDIAGVPGVVFEVKSGGRIDMPRWMGELLAEIRNDDADTGAVVIRPKGKPAPADWWAAMPLPVYVQLLVDAGYITPPAGDVTPHPPQ